MDKHGYHSHKGIVIGADIVLETENKNRKNNLCKYSFFFLSETLKMWKTDHGIYTEVPSSLEYRNQAPDLEENHGRGTSFTDVISAPSRQDW